MFKLKGIVCISLVLVLCFALGGCMNAYRQPEPTPEYTMGPTNGVTNEPNATNGIGAATPAPGASPLVAFDWMQRGKSIEDNINRISEISASRVIVNGGTALVGVQFASQYKGELTGRIRDMVAAEVQNADPAIQKVAVTAEPNDVTKINEIADKIQGGAPANQFEGEIDAIVRNATTLS